MAAIRTYGIAPFRVALLHGGPGAGGEMAPVARELALLLGILEPLQSAHTVSGQVEELHAQLLKKARFPIILVGYSWGAWLALLYADRYPERVRSLILVSSGPFREQYAKTIMDNRLRRLSVAERLEVRLLMEKLETRTNNQDFARFGALLGKADSVAPLPDEEKHPVHADIFQAVWPQAAALRSSGELLGAAARLTCPVVAIHGDNDPHPAAGVKEPLRTVIDDFTFHLLPRCGHTPWLERHARGPFYALLKDLLAKRFSQPGSQ